MKQSPDEELTTVINERISFFSDCPWTPKCTMPHMHRRLRQRHHGWTTILSEEEKRKRGNENSVECGLLKSSAKGHVLSFIAEPQLFQAQPTKPSIRIAQAPIGRAEAEVPTCRGLVPIRNFASPASSTSNLASARQHAWFQIRALPPAHIHHDCPASRNDGAAPMYGPPPQLASRQQDLRRKDGC